MLNIGCVKTPEYGPEYVDILFDMIRRNLPEGTEGRLTCYTNDPSGINPDIHIETSSSTRSVDFMFPLNCCVIGSLDCMLDGKAPESAIYDGSIPKTAKIVAFHNTKAEECSDWVKHVWKIGGSTTPCLTFIPNVGLEKRSDNVKSSLVRDCRWFEPKPAHDRKAIIIGGGPSLSYELDTIRLMDGDIWAINNVPKFLKTHQIKPDFHVLMDAHECVAGYVSPDIRMTRYYASQCEPSVLDLAGDELVCWHAASDCLKDIEITSHPIGGGTTAVMRTLPMLYGLGYRDFHLFGLDSSFEGGRAHAYDQHGYDTILDVICGDQVFKSSPQMVGQAEDFKIMAPDLIAAGCEITVYGDGLLKSIVMNMTNRSENV